MHTCLEIQIVGVRVAHNWITSWVGTDGKLAIFSSHLPKPHVINLEATGTSDMEDLGT